MWFISPSETARESVLPYVTLVVDFLVSFRRSRGAGGIAKRAKADRADIHGRAFLARPSPLRLPPPPHLLLSLGKISRGPRRGALPPPRRPDGERTLRWLERATEESERQSPASNGADGILSTYKLYALNEIYGDAAARPLSVLAHFFTSLNLSSIFLLPLLLLLLLRPCLFPSFFSRSVSLSNGTITVTTAIATTVASSLLSLRTLRDSSAFFPRSGPSGEPPFEFHRAHAGVLLCSLPLTTAPVCDRARAAPSTRRDSEGDRSPGGGGATRTTGNVLLRSPPAEKSRECRVLPARNRESGRGLLREVIAFGRDESLLRGRGRGSLEFRVENACKKEIAASQGRPTDSGSVIRRDRVDSAPQLFGMSSRKKWNSRTFSITDFFFNIYSVYAAYSVPTIHSISITFPI